MNNPHPQEQEQASGRTPLDTLLAYIAWIDAHPQLSMLHLETIRAAAALAQACRDAEAILTYMGMHDLKAEDSTRIANVLIALQPLLAPIDDPEGDEAEAGGV